MAITVFCVTALACKCRSTKVFVRHARSRLGLARLALCRENSLELLARRFQSEVPVHPERPKLLFAQEYTKKREQYCPYKEEYQ